MSEGLCVNPGKEELVGTLNNQHYCYAIKTRVITKDDSLEQVMETYVRPVLEKQDILFISEKMVACTQGRAIPMKDIQPGFWARLLSRFVTKNPSGIGLAMPETMQCAIWECGLPRILFASFISVIGKIFGQKGWFYKYAGFKAAGIDGPCHWTIPPYNEYVVLSPENPEKTAAQLSKQLGGNIVLIVDLNDLGGEILGSSPGDIDREYLLSMLKQNPLGQSDQSTPMGILRPSVSQNAAGLQISE